MIDTSLLVAGVAIIIAVPAVFAVANFVRKRVPHGEARFDENGKLIDND